MWVFHYFYKMTSKSIPVFGLKCPFYGDALHDAMKLGFCRVEVPTKISDSFQVITTFGTAFFQSPHKVDVEGYGSHRADSSPQQVEYLYMDPKSPTDGLGWTSVVTNVGTHFEWIALCLIHAVIWSSAAGGRSSAKTHFCFGVL